MIPLIWCAVISTLCLMGVTNKNVYPEREKTVVIKKATPPSSDASKHKLEQGKW